MNSRRAIALFCGGTVSTAILIAGAVLFVFHGGLENSDSIMLGAVALGPALMFSAMAGYAVWWGVLFLLTLVLPQER
jgi:hypothetical protein